uniref:Uncharacterized protein n=1 Tax=Periophthalmus magnuspinnatus TaxID=409849 RepID=A0A3B4AQ55_9GOBI
RGWNDPPQFSYGLQTSRGAHRNLLTKRAPPAGQRLPAPRGGIIPDPVQQRISSSVGKFIACRSFSSRRRYI